MAKKMLIDATHPEETRVVVADGRKVEEFDFETASRLRLAGNIYLAKVTRVEPALQAAFVDYGGSRHGFLGFSEIHPDYYQIPVADRQAILAEEEALDRIQAAESDVEGGDARPSRRRGSKTRAQAASLRDSVKTSAAVPDEISGMGVIDLDAESGAADTTDIEGSPDETDDGTEQTAKPDDAATADATEHDAADDVTDEDRAGAEGSENADPIERDDRIESITGDEAEELRQPRKHRPRPYKIQEVIKVRQILLVQVIKEERGNKGAALTTYISLAGRYCVLMPNTARGGGISRKITNAPDRIKLKEIASKLDVPKGAGLIIRTAGAKRTKSEIKRDYDFLQRLWEQIRELTLNSIAPVQVYEEGNLIKRSIRDLYDREIDEVLVEGDTGYRTARDFMKMLMPSHVKNVRSYQDPLPLFVRHQVEGQLSSMYNPMVQLKSGGHIVIGVTEALVAIDVNSGRATREGSVEGTALKTNLEAAEEIARQLRLRDLAGLIVIDFIDMDERRNNAAVEKRFKDGLKSDRARIRVGQISGFGLLEMSRQRQRPGMIEVTTQPCEFCHGNGRVRSSESLALSLLRLLEEEGARRRQREMLLRAPVGVVNFLINQKREHLAGIENRYGMSVQVEADPAMVSPDYTLGKFRSETRKSLRGNSVVSVAASMTPGSDNPEGGRDPVEDADSAMDAESAGTPADGGAAGKRSKGRRRSRSKKSRPAGEQSAEVKSGAGNAADASESSAPVAEKEKKARKSRRKRSGRTDRNSGKLTQDVNNANSESDAAPGSVETQDAFVGPEVETSGSPDPLESAVAIQEAGLGMLIDPDPAHSPDVPDSAEDSGTVALQIARPDLDSGDIRHDPAKTRRRGWWKVRE